MSPTSRNTLMIGGALILIALLLVCGPLTDRLGSGGSKVDEAPSVAAGPPADASGALGAAATGALAGATLGEAGADVLAAEANDDPCDRRGGDTELNDADCPPVVGAGETVSGAGLDAGAAVAAGTAVAVGATAATVAADGTGGGSSIVATPPPVSAGVPVTPVASQAAVPAIPVVPAATGVFDDAVVSARNSNGGVGPAGRIVDRFPPPVAAPANTGLRVASALSSGPLIIPCDTPGSGCRNVIAGSGPNPPGGVNPPIVPGGPPPGSVLNNPPIVPGSPPPPS